MAAEVTMTASWGNDSTLEVLADLIEKREKAMRYETTENAVIATSITVLTSIRARTKVANPKDSGGVIVAERKDLVPSFRSIGGGKSVVCVRFGLRGAVDYSHPFHCVPSRISDITKVFIVRDLASSSMKIKHDYYVIADTQTDAEEYANSRHALRVEKHSGMAKWALGLAQSKVSNKPTSMNQTTNKAKIIATDNVSVTKQGDGYSSGTFTVCVGDLLRYAMLAMQGREADLELALQKAANSTAAKIRKVYDLGFDGYCPTPFPEIVGR